MPPISPIDEPLDDGPTETVISESELVSRTVLFALVVAEQSGKVRSGISNEHVHAIDRCLKRMRRAAEAFGGRNCRAGGNAVLALFVDADAALQAACEIGLRVRDLPPLAGVQLSCSVGLDTGPLVADGNDAFGESVDNAKMLAGLARTGQNLAMPAVAHALSPLLSDVGHAIEVRPASGDDPVSAVEYGCAEVLDRINQPVLPIRKTQSLRMILSLGQDSTTVNAKRATRTIGRDIGNDLAVAEPRASRTHARIEMRGESFMLIDISRNGTFVRLASGRQLVLRKAEMELPEQGLISLGRPCAPDALCISFEIARN